MERDFLRLSIQSGSLNVKEEVNDDSKNSVPERSSVMQWSFSNKVSAVPQLLSFKASHENRPRKAVNDPLGPSTLMTISCPDTTHKTFSAATIQRNFVQENQNGNHYSMTVYNPQEMTIVPNQHNQTIPASLNAPVFQSRITSTVTNDIPSTIRAQPFGGLPIVSSLPHGPTIGSVVGTTDLRNAPPKLSAAPTQLTMFYGGTVNVFEDISPEKAQAIMSLASNDSLTSQNKQVPVDTSVPRPSSTADGFIRNWSFSGIPSTIPMTIHTDTQFGGYSNTNVLAIVKTVGGSAPSSNLQLSESPKVVSSVGPSTTTVIPTVAVPQARKASLTRFLEKRKERVISAAPYNLPKKSSDCGVPGSDGASLSINSSSSSPLSAMN